MKTDSGVKGRTRGDRGVWINRLLRTDKGLGSWTDVGETVRRREKEVESKKNGVSVR